MCTSEYFRYSERTIRRFQSSQCWRLCLFLFLFEEWRIHLILSTSLECDTLRYEDVLRTIGAIQKVCHRPRGEGDQAKYWQRMTRGRGSSKKVMWPLINFQNKFPEKIDLFYCKTSYFKVWTILLMLNIMLISYAPLLLVVLVNLQEARLCKCRTRLACEDYSCKLWYFY